MALVGLVAATTAVVSVIVIIWWTHASGDSRAVGWVRSGVAVAFAVQGYAMATGATRLDPELLRDVSWAVPFMVLTTVVAVVSTTVVVWFVGFVVRGAMRDRGDAAAPMLVRGPMWAILPLCSAVPFAVGLAVIL